MNTLIPFEITKCTDTGKETASFKYYEGLKYCNNHNIKKSKTTNYSNKEFIICCGEVMIKVNSDEFKNIKRRMI